MHEMALAQSLVDIIEEYAARDGFSRVLRVNLSLGALAHVDAAALQFGFEVVCRGTVAEGSALLIQVQPGLAFCVACSRTVEIEARGAACPLCGSGQVMATGGDEMRVSDLEVE